MLRPGTRITFDGAPGTVERVVGPGEVIVRTSKGKFVVHERFLSIARIRTPEAPGAHTPSSEPPVSPPVVKEEVPEVKPDYEHMTRAELVALAVAKGFEVPEDCTPEDIIEALKSE